MFSLKTLVTKLFKGDNEHQLRESRLAKFLEENPSKFAISLVTNGIIAEKQFEQFIKAAPFCYMRYEIAKRNNRGVRLIAQPSRDLKIVQAYCISLLKADLPVHHKALAYVSNTSIKKNAELHASNNYLLKMDFKDFFPSITPMFFEKIAAHHGVDISEADLAVLTRLLFWRPIRNNKRFELSIGAPSSPFISNAVMYFFDKALDEECIKRNIVYSRYADDLTFSTNEKGVLFAIPELVKAYSSNYCFGELAINNEKTVFSSKKFNRHVTGITLTNDDKLSLGRTRKRYIRSLVYLFSMSKLDDERILKLKGYLGYAKFVEPDFVSRLADKFGDGVLTNLYNYKIEAQEG